MTRNLTINERWGIQRSKEAIIQAKVNARACAPDADPLEQMYTHVASLLRYGTEEEQHSNLDAVGIPREMGV